jgi:hypothetical protein
MKQLLFVLPIFLLPFLGLSQLTQGEQNRILRSAFNHFAGGSINPGEIATYGTLDVVNAGFSLKGTFPLQRREDKQLLGKSFSESLRSNNPGKVSYLSVSVSGNLTDKNYGALFSNSSLNTGVNLQAQYNFGFHPIGSSYSLFQVLDVNSQIRQLILSNAKASSDLSRKFDYQLYDRTQQLMLAQYEAALKKTIAADSQYHVVKELVDAYGNDIGNHPEMVDSLSKALTGFETAKSNQLQVKYSLDSLGLLGRGTLGAKENYQIETLQPKLRKDYDSILQQINFLKIKFIWFTFSSSFSRVSYSTFNPTLLFVDQIDKNRKDAFAIGGSFNYLNKDSMRHRLFFVNLNLLYGRTNNLGTLSTTSIDQTQKIVNPGGDITRTLTNKYTVYTDPVTARYDWGLSGNVYYMFSKSRFGLHAAPSINFNTNQVSVVNQTAGFLISFQNTVKDQPIVNTEIFVRFNDLLNAGQLQTKFWNRTDIGVAFTFPINLY